MSPTLLAAPPTTDRGLAQAHSDATSDRWRRRAMRVTTVITVGCLVVLAVLLANRHTTGEEIWGPMTAVGGIVVGLLSLGFLATRSRNRAARVILVALWLTIAFLGYGGYNDHRLPRPADTVADQRPRPPLAPLMFTAWGIAGAGAVIVASRAGRPTETASNPSVQGA
jgi:peptidoglycan/LPS O-acetylase OafA/YrhL